MTDTKKKKAVEFINGIRAMDPHVLMRLITAEAGEELSQFFLAYSANLLSKDPNRMVENASSLMLMGYLIRADEEERIATMFGGAAKPASA